MTPDNDELTAADRDALKRALALAQAESEGRREQLARKAGEWMVCGRSLRLLLAPDRCAGAEALAGSALLRSSG